MEAEAKAAEMEAEAKAAEMEAMGEKMRLDDAGRGRRAGLPMVDLEQCRA
jgi:hypothetical protein